MQPEIEDLFDQAQGLGALINETARLLRARKEDRENDAEASSDELAAENRLHFVLCDCKVRLREMKRNFAPLQKCDGDVSITQLRDLFNFDPNTEFWKKQQDGIEWQHRTISVALQMLEFHRSRGERSRREAERAHFVQLANLLQECRNLPPGGPPGGPVSPENEMDEQVEVEYSDSGGNGALEQDVVRTGHSGAADDDPIDTPISKSAQISSNSTRAPSQEAVRSDSLMTAVKMKNPRTQIGRVRALLRTEEICVRDGDDWTLLHHAVLQENVPLLRLLLQQPKICERAYLDARNSSGHTALMESSKRSDHQRGSQLAHLLLEHNCDVNVFDDSEQRRSALYFVVQRPANDYSISVANALLVRKADVLPILKGLPDKKGYPEVNKAVEQIKRQRKANRGSLSKRLIGNVLH